MHLARERARLRAQLDIPRPNAFVGKLVGEILHDGERLPHVHVAIDQHRHEAGRRIGGEPRLEVRIAERRAERDQDFLERNAERLHGDPRPERPRRIVLVGDDELHAASAGRRFTSGQSYSNFGMTQVSRSAARRHSCPRRQRGHRLHVGFHRRAHVDVVGDEALHYRRIHRVRGGELAEQERPPCPVSSRAHRSRFPARARCPPAQRRRARAWRADARSSCRTRCATARSRHASRSRSRAHAPAPLVGRPEAGVRKFLGEVFEDRERLPHMGVAVDQDRHLAAGRMLEDLLAAAIDVERDHFLVERECPRPSSRSTAGTTRTNSSCCR